MANKIEPQGTEQSFSPQIRHARIQIVDIYEISEAELVILERGSPDSIFLNFAIFLLSVALALTIALLTTTITSITVLNVFIVCTVIGFVGGALLLTLWYRNRNAVADCAKAIRKRLPSTEPEESIPMEGESKDTSA